MVAIPFFRNTLLSDLLYSALLFGGLALAGKTLADCRRRRAESSLMMKQKAVFAGAAAKIPHSH